MIVSGHALLLTLTPFSDGLRRVAARGAAARRRPHGPGRRRALPAVVGQGSRPLPRDRRGDGEAPLGTGGADSGRRSRRPARGRVASRPESSSKPMMAAPEGGHHRLSA